MRRRAFLAALTAGTAAVAGCGSRIETPTFTPAPVDESPPDTPTGDEPTDTPDGNGASGLGAASIVDLETVPRTYALAPLQYHSDDGAEVSVEFVSTATADHPARVRATLRNANPFANTFGLEWTPPFGRLASEIPHRIGERFGDEEHTYRASLVFAPTANHDLVDDPPTVERADGGLWRLAGEGDQWLPERVRLAPDESVEGEYAVVGRAEGAGTGKGRPTGVYEFSRPDERPLRITVWNTERPGPGETSRFAGSSVPPLSDEHGTAWYHEADGTTPSYVRPSTERADLPAAVEFTFVNHAREGTGCGHWNLYKLVDGEWFHLGPYLRTAECRIVRPGGWKTWTLHAYPGEALDAPEVATFDYLGGGRYAAVAGYGHATSESAALVELLGGPVSVVPTEDVTAERSDGTVTVTTRRREGGEDASPATLTVTRADRADRRLIPEQAMRRRFRALRNALAFFEPGVEEVVVRTDERSAERVVGYEEDRRRFRVGEQAYEARVERRGDE